MKIKLLALLVSFWAVAETVNNEYILSVPNKLYKNSITVVQSNGNGDNGIEEPITPSCGASNNGSFNFTPNQLCNVGTASSVVENTTTYNWSCTNDNITVNCSATLIPSPVCGTADGVGVDLKPTENLCEKGTASSVITANGQHTWTCESGGEFYSFAFSYYASTTAEKGYAYKGYKGGQNDSGAWLIYVR